MEEASDEHVCVVLKAVGEVCIVLSPGPMLLPH